MNLRILAPPLLRGPVVRPRVLGGPEGEVPLILGRPPTVALRFSTASLLGPRSFATDKSGVPNLQDDSSVLATPCGYQNPLGGMEPWPVQLRLFGILSSSSAHLGCDDGRAVLWSSWRGTGGSLNALGGMNGSPRSRKRTVQECRWFRPGRLAALAPSVPCGPQQDKERNYRRHHLRPRHRWKSLSKLSW